MAGELPGIGTESMRHLIRIVVASVLLCLLIVDWAVAQDDPVVEIIRSKVEHLEATGELTVRGQAIASLTVLPDIYEARCFRLAWTDSQNVEGLLHAVTGIEEDGLDPGDYHLGAIRELFAEERGGETQDPVLTADLDLLLTDSLVRLGYHLNFGKVDPESLDPQWNLAREIDDRDPAVVIQALLDSGSIAGRLEALRNPHVIFERLKAALAKYRAIEAAGGWKPVPPGPDLERGTKDARVPLLRERLSMTGDLASGASDSTRFDRKLEEAVSRFQERHRLPPDGVVGPGTLEAVNVTVETRIDQIRVNLERARWVFHSVHGKFVLVDIAGFEVAVRQEDGLTWTCRAQVGKPYHETPVFRSDIKYLVFCPTWTIPPGILEEDTLPAVKRDPDYLAKRNINVIDRNGNVVDQASIDWSKYSAQDLPYALRQEPGPNNALGQIKFIFPNPHLVYLHDTPSKSLFDHTDRAFSSGCIRVEKPFELAELLLNDPEKWNQEEIKKAIESGKTRTVFLPVPVPVLLFYWTVEPFPNGEVHFKSDLYGRDEAILEGLNGEFRFRKRPTAGRPTL
jgi:murein L,D-transpeptidase YcbB/YkuD